MSLNLMSAPIVSSNAFVSTHAHANWDQPLVIPDAVPTPETLLALSRRHNELALLDLVLPMVEEEARWGKMGLKPEPLAETTVDNMDCDKVQVAPELSHLHQCVSQFEHVAITELAPVFQTLSSATALPPRLIKRLAGFEVKVEGPTTELAALKRLLAQEHLSQG